MAAYQMPAFYMEMWICLYHISRPAHSNSTEAANEPKAKGRLLSSQVANH